LRLFKKKIFPWPEIKIPIDTLSKTTAPAVQKIEIFVSNISAADRLQ